MFVILCVIAGATSHTISNTSKTPINQLNNHYRASFMDFILDSSLTDLLQQSANTINKDLAIQYSSDHQSTATKVHQQSQTVCALLSSLLSGQQMKFCQRYQDVLETVLPQVIQLTKKECTRITKDLRWSCSAIEIFLDRSTPLAFTKEAALVRSILNASMMYLVVKTCSDASHRSCGCLNNQPYSVTTTTATSKSDIPNSTSLEGGYIEGYNSSFILDHQDFTPSDLSRLHAGTPLRLTKSITRRQGCSMNMAFADAFTKLFIDLDDTKSLNKAYRILNEDLNYNWINNRNSSVRRLVDSDYKDLAYIKWTKSAINLHNNHLGRQMVRQATHRLCRCHGVSGVCQFQTCWDQLLDFDVITSRLKSIYLNEASKVEVKNLGTLEKPDLYLNHSKNLLHLYESPDYCESQPKIRHPGTKGRSCAAPNNVNLTTNTSKKNLNGADLKEVEHIENKPKIRGGDPGSCEQLCCNRGYHSELVLDMVTCNCRFQFCCKVVCDHCLRQRLQHNCL